MVLEEFRKIDLTWDKATRRIYDVVRVASSDENGRKLVVQVLNDGQVEDLSGTSLHLYWKTTNEKNKGLDAFEEVDASKGIFQIYFTTEMASNVGNLTAHLHLVDDQGAVTSEPFKISVFEGVDNDAVESSDSFSSLTKILIEATDLEKNYTPQLAELKENDENLTTQLAQTAKKDLTRNISDSSVVNIANKESRRPLVTFIDDDGAIDVYTRLKPIFESRGVPCTIGIVSDWVGKEQVGDFGKAMTQGQILELQNLGWEIASHSKTHIPLNTVNDKKIIRQELRESKNKLLEMGFDVKNYVYPYGQSNSAVREEVAKIYKVATQTNIATNDETNVSPLNNTTLKRVALGSYGSGSDTLEHHKSVIDKAISENSWVIFMTHIWAQDEEKDQLIADVLDYAISKQVEIVNVDEGLNTFGDKLNVDGFFRVLPDDSVISDKSITLSRHLNPTVAEVNDFGFFTRNFRNNHIVYSLFDQSSVPGMPENKGGVLKTQRLTSGFGFSEQEYVPYNSSKVWRRKLSANGAWETWEYMSSELSSSVTSEEIHFDVIPAQSSKHIEVPTANASHAYSDFSIVRPYFSLPSGIVYDSMPRGSGAVRIRLTNVTSNDITVPKDRWSVKVIKGYV